MTRKWRSKRGRPKVDSPLRDKGTPELQFKRIELVRGGNPNMSSSPIDILCERKIIELDQYNAGLTFWYLHMKIFGKPFPQSNAGKLLSPIKSRSMITKSSKKDEEIYSIYNECRKNIIRQCGQSGYRILSEVLIFHENPPYIYYSEIKVEDSAHKNTLRDALDSIKDFFRNFKKKRR